MPLNRAQLAELVNRARHKAPPVVGPIAHHHGPTHQVTPAPPQAPSTTQLLSQHGKLQPKQPVVAAMASPAHTLPIPAVSTSPAEDTAEVEDFPIGWQLKKESWHFHRRFYAIFKRAMHCGEYSQLLGQIRRRTAEHLGEDCWRITLPGSSRTLPVRATPWRLITILPKNWQSPKEG